MVLSKYTPTERLIRKRSAARLRQQRCRARKRAAATKDQQEEGHTHALPNSKNTTASATTAVQQEQELKQVREHQQPPVVAQSGITGDRYHSYHEEKEERKTIAGMSSPQQPAHPSSSAVRYIPVRPPPPPLPQHAVGRPPQTLERSSAPFCHQAPPPPPGMVMRSSMYDSHRYPSRNGNAGNHIRRVSTSRIPPYGMQQYSAAPPPPQGPPMTGVPMPSYKGRSRTIVIPGGAHVVVHPPHAPHHHYVDRPSSSHRPSPCARPHSHYGTAHPVGPPPSQQQHTVMHHSPNRHPYDCRPLRPPQQQHHQQSQPPPSQELVNYHQYPTVVSRTSSRDDSTSSLSSSSHSSESLSAKRAVEDPESAPSSPEPKRPTKKVKTEETPGKATETTPTTALWNKEKAAIAAMLTLGNTDTNSGVSSSNEDTDRGNDTQPTGKESNVNGLVKGGVCQHQTAALGVVGSSSNQPADGFTATSSRRNPIIGIIVPGPRPNRGTMDSPLHPSSIGYSAGSANSAFRPIGKSIHA